MKKFIITAACALLVIVPALARDRYTTDATQLPAEARLIIVETFGQNKINHIKIDEDMYGTSYDVILNNGTELEFDRQGRLTEVEAGRNGVPAKLVPAPIRAYVKANYKNAKITSLDINRDHYEVGLAGGLDLRFDKNGRFLGVDD
ncbi:MAG: PepSY-like domain-containing protein [Muribaculaceae bacterium]